MPCGMIGTTANGIDEVTAHGVASEISNPIHGEHSHKEASKPEGLAEARETKIEPAEVRGTGDG